VFCMLDSAKVYMPLAFLILMADKCPLAMAYNRNSL